MDVSRRLIRQKKDIAVVKICANVLKRLSVMDYEKNDKKRKEKETKKNEIKERLIFPMKIQAKGTKKIDRISEQELRFLFVEEFKKKYKHLYYSVETPTEEKYKFGKSYKEIVKNVDIHKTSASIDMCVFNKIENTYERILNIEFKHKNTSKKNIAKDILKLSREKQNGAFVLLLNNTNKGRSRGTLWNENNTGVFNKFSKSFSDFERNWCGKDKSIHLIIMSLSQNTLIHRKIIETDLDELHNIFFEDSGCCNIKEVEGRGWEKY